jgi:hypothetical protein
MWLFNMFLVLQVSIMRLVLGGSGVGTPYCIVELSELITNIAVDPIHG